MALLQKYRSTLLYIQTLDLYDEEKYVRKFDRYGYCEYTNEDERFFVNFNLQEPVLVGYVTKKESDGSYTQFVFSHKTGAICVIYELGGDDIMINMEHYLYGLDYRV